MGFGLDLAAGLLEGKPKIPKFVPIDVQAQQIKAIEGNISALPGAENLAGQINTFNQSEYDRMLEDALPGYNRIKDKIGGNIEAMVSGQIPQDVQDEIARQSASRALYGGFGGTGMGRNLVARDFGLTSLKLTQQGLDSATRWMSAAKAPQFDLSSMFISPTFQTQFAAGERDSKFQRDYVSNMNDWQHSFGYLAGQDVRATGETIKSLLSSYLGGGMGGGAPSGGGSSGGGGTSYMPNYNWSAGGGMSL